MPEQQRVIPAFLIKIKGPDTDGLGSDKDWIKLSLAFLECLHDPVIVLGCPCWGDCGSGMKILFPTKYRLGVTAITPNLTS